MTYPTTLAQRIYDPDLEVWVSRTVLLPAPPAPGVVLHGYGRYPIRISVTVYDERQRHHLAVLPLEIEQSCPDSRPLEEILEQYRRQGWRVRTQARAPAAEEVAT